ncbi:MAG TPA: ABC transporter ATP-binding protein, partial [Spirochaetia bacterium]|nr:ABC transporter ATP-binding protein [Spirochaetia bacterium]
MAVLEVQDLRKSYGDLDAVRGVSFSVAEGEVFGILGPNGAGKTTTLEIIEGLRRTSSGTVRIMGNDAERDRDRIKELVGIQLQSTSFLDSLTVREILDLFGSFYRQRLDTTELLDRVGLGERARVYVKKLSGGQQQRLALALALVNDPRLMFLDEPTMGLDPQARRSLWDTVRSLRDEGRTVVLTTHYMEEAQELCDRVAILDHGRIMALDSPGRLIAGAEIDYRVQFEAADIPPATLRELADLGRLEQEGGGISIYCRELGPVLRLLGRLSEEGLEVQGLAVRAP